MQSDGGLTPMSSFCGNRAILSGPAGGVVGYARTTHPPSSDKATHLGKKTKIIEIDYSSKKSKNNRNYLI